MELTIPDTLLEEMKKEMESQAMIKPQQYILRAIRQQVNRDRANRERGEAASARRRGSATT